MYETVKNSRMAFHLWLHSTIPCWYRSYTNIKNTIFFKSTYNYKHMETGICIRKAQEQDASAVHRLICMLEELEFDKAKFETFYLANLKDPRNIYLVASVNGKVAAFISCHGQLLLHHLDIVYEIQEMIVEKALRGLGLGIGLMRHLEKELRLRNCQLLEVCSSKLRDQAHEFYQNTGFNRTHYKFTKSYETLNAN